MMARSFERRRLGLTLRAQLLLAFLGLAALIGIACTLGLWYVQRIEDAVLRLVAAVPSNEDTRFNLVLAAVEVSRREVIAVTGEAARMIQIVMPIGLFITLVMALVSARRLMSPLGELTNTMTRLAAGDLATRVDGADRRDEIGAMARALEIFRENARAANAAAAQKEADHIARQERARRVDELCREHETSVQSVVAAWQEAADRMRSSSAGMGKRIDVTIAQSTEAAKSASQTAISVATVAHSTRDLAISHEEMSRYAIQAEETARGAACEAKLAAARISELAETAEQVGQVVGIIREVAAQINLLALNATIEAARAGEAGRGFAVVANEVKALAAQTSQASAGVGDLIQASQSATRAATDAIARIAIAVAQTHEIATSVASVSQEQSVTTKVISGATEDAAARTGEVLALARNVSDGMRLTEEAAGEFERASTLLSTEGDRVQASIVAFLERIRAA